MSSPFAAALRTVTRRSGYDGANIAEFEPAVDRAFRALILLSGLPEQPAIEWFRAYIAHYDCHPSHFEVNGTDPKWWFDHIWGGVRLWAHGWKPPRRLRLVPPPRLAANDCEPSA